MLYYSKLDIIADSSQKNYMPRTKTDSVPSNAYGIDNILRNTEGSLREGYITQRINSNNLIKKDYCGEPIYGDKINLGTSQNQFNDFMSAMNIRFG